jgi:hypothetical protein
MSTNSRDEMLARLLAGETVPEADDTTRHEATLLQEAIRHSFEADVSVATQEKERARAFEIAQKRWAEGPNAREAISPEHRNGVLEPNNGRRDAMNASPWWSRLMQSIESMLPRPQAWAFATIAAAVIGITLSLQYQGSPDDDPYQVRGGDLQTVTLTVPDPAAKAEEIRNKLAELGLGVKVRQEGVFYFVDVTGVTLPAEMRVTQAFTILGLPSPISKSIEVGLRPYE